jgi:apolipoprotein N-acyltransferase
LNQRNGLRVTTAAASLWAGFPPLGCWPLGIIGVAIYLGFIVQPEPLGRRTWWWLWVSSALTWLGLLQGIRLAFWPLYFGWIALSLYLAVYLVLFVAAARSLFHKRGWPLFVAVPAAWLTMELIRGYFVTGFSGCLLGHMLSKHPQFIQSAAHFGTYGVSALVLFAAITLFRFVQILNPLKFHGVHGQLAHSNLPSLILMGEGSGVRASSFPSYLEATICSFIVLLFLSHGYFELTQASKLSSEPLFTAALIQENAPTVFEANEYRNQRSWQSYLDQTRLAASIANERLDLVVWPESVFTRNEPWFDWDRSKKIPTSIAKEGIDFAALERIIDSYNLANEEKVQALRFAVNANGNSTTRFLVGADIQRIRGEQYDRLNAALWLEGDGKLADYYAKRHLVMFGEYIPLGDYIPLFYSLIGMQPASAGNVSKSLFVATANGKTSTIVPSICFENMVPHFLRRLLDEAAKQSGVKPDVMINVTNDGWFHGSSISDIHLNNAILAAVENRRPFLIAANVGLTAWIDGSGRIQEVAKRLQPASVIAKPSRDNRWGLWQALGDWPIRILAILVTILWLGPALRNRFLKVR